MSDGWDDFRMRYPRAVDEFQRRMWLEGHSSTSLTAWFMEYLSRVKKRRLYRLPVYDLVHGGQEVWEPKKVLDQKENWNYYIYLITQQLKAFEEAS